MHLKPHIELREPECERELLILVRINELINANSRTPRLKCVVISGEDEEMVMGTLTRWIHPSPLGKYLREPKFYQQHEFHKNWKHQFNDILRELHVQKVVRRDVNPSNIVIDEKMNAWVNEFGSMNNAEFVDDAKIETKQEDEQGVTKIFKEWFPLRNEDFEVL